MGDLFEWTESVDQGWTGRFDHGMGAAVACEAVSQLVVVN